MAGVMHDEFAGGTLVTAAMSDDMAAGLGLRCTAPLDLWVHGLMGMEERPATCAADAVLLELAGTLYEREYGPSAHVAAVARHQGTVVTTTKTGFRPLMKTAQGVRNLIPGGGGGGGNANTSPPAAPPPTDGGASDAAGTLQSMGESGGALGRGATGGDDTDDIASVVRTVESASDATDVEELQHPASTADNLDDLARVDIEAEVEGAGYRQVAEIYEQPLPAAATPEPDAALGAGPDSAAAGSGYKKAPELDLTAPGAEGYDFQNAYGPLRDQVEHYRADSNWRGNMFTREYLQGIDAKATELFEGLGGDAAAIAGDNRGYRTSNIYAAMEQMASQAEAAGELEALARVQDAMGQLEEFVHGQIVEVAARTDELAGTALGSQRILDPNIDVDKLRSWLEEQVHLAEEQFGTAQSMEDAQRASWTRDYYDQLLKSLNAGMNPLAESSEQTIFIQVTKVNAFNEQYTAQTAGELAALGLDSDEFAIIPPRAPDQDQLDVYLALHDGFVETLSDPEYFRSAEEVGDHYMAALPNGAGPGPDPDGPGALHPPGGVDEIDANPGPVAGESPPSPDRPLADSPPGSGSAAASSPARRPPPLDLTLPGAEGYEFEPAYRSLQERNLFYREDFNFRGNFFMRESLQTVDKEALALFTGLDGPTDAIEADHFGRHAASVYANLQTMAGEADAAGDVDRAAEIHAAMHQIEATVNRMLADAAARADEFSGAALGSPRSPIDRHIDIAKLRNWLADQAQRAQDMQMAAETPEAQKRAGWEWGYYLSLLSSLDEGVNPLAPSNEKIAILRNNELYPYWAQFPDDMVAAAKRGEDSGIPRIPVQDEIDFYTRLQELFVATLANPEFHRSAGEIGTDAFTAAVQGRLEAGLDFLGPDSLRPFAGDDIPPPLPAADFSDGAVDAGEVRDRSFARSALAASEETLERQAAGLGRGDASVRGAAPVPDSAPPEPSFDARRAPPDSARAPIIDEQSGRWAMELHAETDASPAPADLDSISSRTESVSSQASDVSWESGFQVSDDSELGSAAGDAGDVRHGQAPDDDGASGSLATRPDGTAGEDANPTGTTPTGASASGADAGAAGTRSDLYGEPVSFEGRSLEGVSRSDEPKELARSLDGADLPVEDLPPGESARQTTLENTDGTPVSDSYRDVNERMIELRLDRAQETGRRFNDGLIVEDSVWKNTMWSGDRRDVAAVREANSRWSGAAAAQRTSPLVSFSDDPRQLLYHVEYERTVKVGGRDVDLFRGVDPPNTVDPSHAAHYVPRPAGWETTRETGFGRLAQGWNEFPFSNRERILNTLQKGEALSSDQLVSLELGLEGYRAAGGELSSSQYRAIVDMISDLGDQHRHARWRVEGERGERLLQLIEMLDYAAMVV